MTPSRLFIASLIASLILFGIPIAASAGSGDPRLVNGVVEWPRVVTNDPFFVVRGDDGVLYYVGVGAARREGALTAGSRVSVLGIEGRSGHEIAAVGIGSGPTAEAALAQLQSARPGAPAAPAPVAPLAPAAPAPAAAAPSEPAVAPTPPSASPTTVAPAPAAPPRVVAAASVAPAAGSRPAAPATPAPRPSVAPTPAPAIAPATPAVTQAAPAVAHAAPAVVQATPAVAAAPVTADARASVAASPAVVTASTTAAGRAVMAQPIVATAPMLPVDDRRWTELVGEVESLSGRTLVLRVDGGRVSVDVSSLSSNLERMVAPGSTVKVYGVPVELRFKAMGFIDPDARGSGR